MIGAIHASEVNILAVVIEQSLQNMQEVVALLAMEQS